MPPALDTKIESLKLAAPPEFPGKAAISAHAAGAGSVIDASFRPLPFLSWRRKSTVAITEFEWNHHFVDVQQKGPFKHWHHRHEFLPETRNGSAGTIVRDVIDYGIGFGILGTLANTLFVEPQMRRLFAQRQRKLPKLLP